MDDCYIYRNYRLHSCYIHRLIPRNYRSCYILHNCPSHLQECQEIPETNLILLIYCKDMNSTQLTSITALIIVISTPVAVPVATALIITLNFKQLIQTGKTRVFSQYFCLPRPPPRPPRPPIPMRPPPRPIPIGPPI